MEVNVSNSVEVHRPAVNTPPTKTSKEIHREVIQSIPKEMFARNPWRLGFFFTQTLVAFVCVWALLTVPMFWAFKVLLGVVIGHCWAMNGLVAHELLHGSIVKSKRLQNFLGFFMLLPFMIAPTYWRYWHNKLHHGNTQRLGRDPDAFPTFRLFKQSRFARFAFPFTPGSGYKRSFLYLFFWFSFNTQATQFYFRFKNKMFEGLRHGRVTFELTLMVLIHVAALWAVGLENFLWLVAIPFFAQNYFAFSYISTNHNLSPLTKDNNPLANSLTVTNHPVLEFLHLNFGYHVEHHLLPTVSPVHNKKVHKLLLEKYPEDYRHMSKWAALKALYSTPRIYKDAKTLMNPDTGETHSTI